MVGTATVIVFAFARGRLLSVTVHELLVNFIVNLFTMQNKILPSPLVLRLRNRQCTGWAKKLDPKIVIVSIL